MFSNINFNTRKNQSSSLLRKFKILEKKQKKLRINNKICNSRLTTYWFKTQIFATNPITMGNFRVLKNSVISFRRDYKEKNEIKV